jgi:prepilin-type N-terminal cleavage/methylation domain-containing protein
LSGTIVAFFINNKERSHFMKQPRNRGFSLIELMVVCAIIGICAAIVVPQLVAHKRTADLADLVNMVQQTASQTRSLALQTRRAASLEVSGSTGKIWVNTLNGPTCWDGISQTCVQTAGHLDSVPEFNINDEPYASAGTALCDVSVSVVTGAGTGSAMCSLSGDLSATSDFAVCYAGNGDLYVRSSADPGAACGEGTATADSAAWERVCPTIGTGADSSGAVLMFNRFEGGGGGACDEGDAVDVTRAVFIPTGGAPYSRVQL